jgi:hypothetical protein
MGGLGLSPSSQPEPLSTTSASAQAETLAVLGKGATWLFLIAGLSLVNTVLAVSGSDWTFLGGLGITAIASLVAVKIGTTTSQVIALIINLWAAGLFVSLGWFARKGQKWAFITGMVVYAVDGVLVLLVQAWLMLLFHGFVFFRLYQGFSSCNELHAFDKRPQTGSGIQGS